MRNNLSVLGLLAVCLLPATMPAFAQSSTGACPACAASLPLPASAVTIQSSINNQLLNTPISAGSTYITGTITNSPAGSALSNGTMGFWCGDWFNASLSLNQTYVP